MNEKELDNLFQLYSQGKISISQIKNKANINQYDFIRELAKRDMCLVYEVETEEEKLIKLNKLFSLYLQRSVN